MTSLLFFKISFLNSRLTHIKLDSIKKNKPRICSGGWGGFPYPVVTLGLPIILLLEEVHYPPRSNSLGGSCGWFHAQNLDRIQPINSGAFLVVTPML